MSPEGTKFIKVTSCAKGAARLLEWRLDGAGPVSHVAYRTSSPHYVEQYGFGGDSSSLVVWIGTADDQTIVLDPASGRVIDRFADEYRLLQTDDPNVAIAVLADGSVVQFDMARHVEVGPRIDFGFDTENVWVRDGHVVASRTRRGRRGSAAGRGLRERRTRGTGDRQWWGVRDRLVRHDAGRLYMVVNRAGRDRIERRDIATGDLLQASTEGYVDFDLRAGVLVARTVDGRIVELDAQSLDPIGAPFPDESRSTARCG